MTERTFTVFEGPDAGMTFVLADKPLTIGREIGRDIVLHDDRASRLHARLVPRGEKVFLVDENSSNGAFVNGALIRECEVKERDVILIGGTRIVYGHRIPSPESVAELTAPATAKVLRRVRQGDMTEVLPEPGPPLRCVETRLTEMLDAVAAAARETARGGIPITVEAELEPDTVCVDPDRARMALSRLLAALLDLLPAGEATLVLRSSLDPGRGGFEIEILCIGVPLPRDRILSSAEQGAFDAAFRIALDHGGTLELLPTDSPDTFARLRLPIGPAGATRETVIKRY